MLLRCECCSHEWHMEAIHPILSDDGTELVSCLLGSDRDFCPSCNDYPGEACVVSFRLAQEGEA